ncbi:MAG: ABC transporter ATP-binding protein [Candidatus Dormibacteria bacterium]
MTALAGLSLSIPRGEVLGFLGPNGAGKTTAVKLLLGLARPTSGQARVLGRPAGDREARRRVGYLPELFRYQSWLSAREVMTFHCELAGLPRPRWRSEVDDRLHLVGLSGRANDRVGTFSKGMQQRLGLGVALLGDPQLVFLDEPTSALDPVGRHDVREIIRELKGRGTAVFLNSHLLSEVEQVCDRVAVVDRGQVIAAGTMSELLSGSTVHVRVTDLPSDALTQLQTFGEATLDGDLLTVAGATPDRVPGLVATLVRLGGSVHSVQPGSSTLEERFLQLLSGPH